MNGELHERTAMSHTNGDISEAITTVPTVHERPLGALFKHIRRFENINNSTPSPSIVGSIPLYKSKLALVDHHRPVYLQAMSEEASEEQEEVQEYEVTRFRDLKQFKPVVLTDQLNEGCITGIKDKNRAVVEQLLNELLQSENYEWSCVEEGDGLVVFVRFTEKELKDNAVKMRRLLSLEGVKIRDTPLGVVVEKNTKQLITDTVAETDEIDLEALQKSLGKTIESHKVEKTNTDLDYVIDENELKDLPSELLPQLIKDIKEFRLKALENEKKKREREVLEEKKRSKAQLRKLMEKFQSDSNHMVEDDESDEEEDDDLTDEQYEEQRIKKENADMIKRFGEKSREVEFLQRKNRAILEDLEELKSYESTLDKTLRSEYETGKFKPSGRNRELELDADKRDKEEEETEALAAKQSENFLASMNIPLKMNIAKNSNVLDLDDEELDKILEQLKPKIDEYIEDALGVKEDELSEYVVSIIKDEKSKEKLLEELKEPFGDDASSLTEKIWADIRQLLA